MSRSLPDPDSSSDVRARLLDYLDFYRDTVVDKVSGLDERQLRSSLLPSGWSPVELVKHLTFMERRWLVWGFLGEQVAEPWGDDRDGRWYVAADEDPAALLAALHEAGRRTRAIVEAAGLSDLADPGGRFDDGAEASLASILLHVLQEYARHAGHLDVVRELIDGRTGE
jgi:uncharacterized damage-inducible protein DinB